MLLEANVRKMLVSGEQWGGWKGYQLPLSSDYVTIWTPIGTAMQWKPGTWISKTYGISYFWPDQWYTIHLSYYPDGRFREAYCDIVLPNHDYTSSARELIYTDLYIDVVVRDNFSVFTKDHEVFERAAQQYPIVRQVQKQAYQALEQLEQQAKTWSGPFSVLPRRLPTKDVMTLPVEQIRKAFHAALQGPQNSM